MKRKKSSLRSPLLCLPSCCLLEHSKVGVSTARVGRVTIGFGFGFGSDLIGLEKTQPGTKPNYTRNQSDRDGRVGRVASSRQVQFSRPKKKKNHNEERDRGASNEFPFFIVTNIQNTRIQMSKQIERFILLNQIYKYPNGYRSKSFDTNTFTFKYTHTERERGEIEGGRSTDLDVVEGERRPEILERASDFGSPAADAVRRGGRRWRCGGRMEPWRGERRERGGDLGSSRSKRESERRCVNLM